jgi:hypothetical protein
VVAAGELLAPRQKIDTLFYAIFAVTMFVGVAVFFYLIKFCIKYRHRPGLKAHFSHGNKKLEMIWTIVPAVLLLGLALWTKGAWDDYRYSPTSGDPNRAQIMVIAEQFNWNVIYPGADGKVGRYLVYPKPTDLKWPAIPPGEDENFFASYGAPGPAYLPQDKALEAINGYISTLNPLGKDFRGRGREGRRLGEVPRPTDPHPQGPADRDPPVEQGRAAQLRPARVPGEAGRGPGMKGLIYFQATKTSASSSWRPSGSTRWTSWTRSSGRRSARRTCGSWCRPTPRRRPTTCTCPSGR